MAVFELRVLEDDGTTVRHRAAAAVDPADEPRFYQAQHAKYDEQVPTGAVDEETGTPVLREMTDDEVFHRFAAALIGDAVAGIAKYERTLAAAQAPAPIAFTPLTGEG